MDPTALELRYSFAIGPGGVPGPRHAHDSLHRRFGTKTPDGVVVQFNRSRFAIDWHGEHRLTAIGGLATDEFLVVEHRLRQYRQIPSAAITHTFGAIEAPKRRLDAAGAPWSAELNGFKLVLERFLMQGALAGEVSLWRNAPGPTAVRQKLWQLLLPGLDRTLSASGLPFELVLRGLESDERVFLRARLTSVKAIPDDHVPELTPPEGYVELRPEERHHRIRRDQDAGTTSPAVSHRAAAMRRAHRLRNGGQDAAWAARPAVLDTAKTAANSVSVLFDRFRGREDVITIDWQQDIADHLDSLDPGFSGGERKRALQLLNLFLRLSQEQSIVSSADDPRGLTDDEREAFEQEMNDHVTGANRNATCDFFGLDNTGCRVIVFHETISNLEASQGRLGQPRVDEIASAQWDQLEQTIELRNRAVRDANCWFQFRAWDFDADIILDNEPLVDALQFHEDGKIHLDLAISEIYVDFQWSTSPNPDGACSMLCAFFTFGLCALLQLNYSPWSHLVVEDARIAVEFEPVVRRGRIRWDVGIDRRRSTFDVDLFLVGVNLVQDIIDIVVSAVGSWAQAFNGDLLDEVEDSIEEALDVPFFEWPEYWHAEDGPALRSDAALIAQDEASLEAHLVHTRGLPRAIAEDVDFELIPDDAGFSFVVSRRYLTAWVNRFARVANVPSTTELPTTEFEAATDIELPDPEDLPHAKEPVDVEDPVRPPFPGCDTTPPAPAAEFFNRVALVRSAMAVRLPDEGVQPVAGRVRANYSLIVEAVRRDFVPTLHLVQEPCVDDAGDFAGFFGGFADFNRWFIPPEWIRGEPFMIDPRMQDLSVMRRAALARVAPEGTRPCCDGHSEPAGSVPEPGSMHVVRREFPGAGGDGVPCPPPMCHWTFPARDTVLVTYVRADVTVTGDLLMGFSKREFWLPQLTLAIPSDTFQTVVDALHVDERFGVEASQRIEEYVVERVRTDLEAYFEPLARSRPAMETSAVPSAVVSYLTTVNGIPSDVGDAIENLIVFRQAGDAEELEYRATESLVYWHITMTQGISGLLSPA